MNCIYFNGSRTKNVLFVLLSEILCMGLSTVTVESGWDESAEMYSFLHALKEFNSNNNILILMNPQQVEFDMFLVFLYIQ